MTREEAINVLNDYDINFERHTAEEVAEAHEMAIEALETQQKTGHWIEHQGTFRPHIECSECSCWFLREDLPRNSYCPNCGSRNHWEWELKMQEVQE